MGSLEKGNRVLRLISEKRNRKQLNIRVDITANQLGLITGGQTASYVVSQTAKELSPTTLLIPEFCPYILPSDG